MAPGVKHPHHLYVTLAHDLRSAITGLHGLVNDTAW